MNLSTLGLLAIVFLTLLLVVYGGYLAWGSNQRQTSRKMKQRIKALSEDRQDKGAQTSILKQNLMNDQTAMSLILKRLPSGRSLDLRLQQSGLGWSVSRFLMIMAGMLVFGVVASMGLSLFIALPLPVRLGLPVLCVASPWLFVNYNCTKRMAKFDAQLPEALDLIARSLQTGLAFMAALTMVSDEFSAPLGEQFRLLNTEISYGASLNDAFNNMVERTPSEDLRYFVIAMLVQRETGGNLAELTGNISQLIRDRLELRNKIQTLTAEGRLSALILTAMPFMLGGAMALLNPEYISLLWTDPAGLKITYGMLIMIGIGNLVMRKMVKIKI
jgi:tight adherence protein B